MLVFGATGSTGRYVVQSALEKGMHVFAYVRNVARVPPQWSAANVSVISGDLNDANAVTAAVKSARPDFIIDASSALPFGQPSGAQKNNADREIAVLAAIRGLRETERLNACYLLIVGGVVIAEPGGVVPTWSYWLMGQVAGLLLPSLSASARRFFDYLFKETPDTFRFTVARPGPIVECPSKGTLVVEATTADNAPRGSIAFADLGHILVDLALMEPTANPWNRKAIFLNYPRV